MEHMKTKSNPSKSQSVELFAGCGGLAFGINEAGFKHAVIIERDPEACATLAFNKERGARHFSDWAIQATDVRSVDFSRMRGIDLVSGGPPCQPFSIGGKHKGPGDKRNMWPEAIRAVRELSPKAFLFENVRGLLRPAFSEYLNFLRLQLSWPEIKFNGPDWKAQLKKLERRERSDADPSYKVLIHGINAADYGAPQKRHRAIILGIRSDIATEIIFPAPTHSREALVWSQRVTGEYWERHRISSKARPAISESDRRLLTRLRKSSEAPLELPWTTVRDVIGDLPRPSAKSEAIINHRLHPGARTYAGHTGSPWDEPAKALKAGSHGVPGGENVLVDRGGNARYFTVREMARLQGLPDEFAINGSWMSSTKQLGNAVPVQIGHVFGNLISENIAKTP